MGLGQAKKRGCSGSWSTGSGRKWWRKSRKARLRQDYWGLESRLKVPMCLDRQNNLCSPLPQIMNHGLRKNKHVVSMPTLNQKQEHIITSLTSRLSPAAILPGKSPWKSCWNPIFSWTHFDQILAPPSTKTTPIQVTHVHVTHVTRSNGVCLVLIVLDLSEALDTADCSHFLTVAYTSLVSPFHSLLLVCWLLSNP